MNAESTDRWQAVVARDRAADDRFVYAVRTTGVYCRPSCASRPPRRENVAFYDSPADAVRDGFRACRRCRPDGPDPRREQARRVVAACRRLEEDAPIGTAALARDAGLGETQFLRLFKRHTGVSPQAYRRRVLAERARADLGRAPTVTDDAFDAGYRSTTRFYEGVGRELGMTPAEARAGAEGHTVSYAVRGCALGRVLVAWTARGVCEVGFGDTDEGLVGDLSRRLPRAVLAADAVPDWVDAVVERVDAGRVRDVPIDIQGTAFQQRVWAELRRIPSGETRSYAEIASAIRRAVREPRGRPGLRDEPGRRPRPLPPGGPRRRRSVGLPLGRVPQGGAARAGAGVSPDLDERGFSVAPLLSAEVCRSIGETWDQPVFRKAVVMARHNFGRGEYRYYADPLPPPIAELRTSLYARLLPIANRWAAGLGMAEFLPTFEAFRAAGPGLPTPLLLKYGPGDYNCLHQDLYGARWFPLQAVILLDEPGVDFEGGELVLVEQRPRAQSRPMVVPLRRGDAR